MYTSMHNHDMFSFLDGYGTPKEMLDKAQEIGLKGYAITNHGNQYSWVYYDQIKHEYPDIKMIYGVEFYEAIDKKKKDKDSKYFHLIVLAKNERGRIAINNLITLGNEEGFYYKPRIELADLAPYADDIVVSSACLGSRIAKAESYSEMYELVDEYSEIFPHYYLEMQAHNNERQIEHNKRILRLSRELRIPYVITTDSHRANKDELMYQKILSDIAKDDQTFGEIYDDCYLKSDKEIIEAMESYMSLDDIIEGLENSNTILDIIEDVNMPFQEPELPHYDLPDGFDSEDEYLWQLCQEGWKTRGFDELNDEEKQVRKERLEYEYKVITDMGFPGYFIITWDFVNFAKENDIAVGAGRGCFKPDGSMIQLSDGTVKQIDQVQVGDEVITHLGNDKKVLNTHEYDCNEKLYKIKYNGKMSFTCTGDHEIFIRRYYECKNPSHKNRWCSHRCPLKKRDECPYIEKSEKMWVRADELREGDWLSFPKTNTKDESHSILLSDFCNENNLAYKTSSDQSIISSRFGTHLGQYGQKWMTNKIEFNESFARFVGYYLGNGWSKTDCTEIGIVINNKFPDQIKDVENLFVEIFGNEPNIRFTDTTTILVMRAKIPSVFMKKICGDCSLTKTVPTEFMNSNPDILKNILYGLIYTDFSIPTARNDRLVLSTSSINLLYQTRLIFSRLGFTTLMMTEDRRGHSHDVVRKSGKIDTITTQNIAYQLDCHSTECEGLLKELDVKYEIADKKYKKKREYRDDHYYYKILGIETEEYSGKVYDLTVEDDCSYTVNGMAVHNSGAGSLITYLLGITDIDPITHGLIFERFLNPSRISLPDLDIDLGDRESVIKYLEKKYGEKSVCQVSNFSYITPKVALKDTARALRERGELSLSYKQVESIAKLFMEDDFADCINNTSKLKPYLEKYPKWFAIAEKISGRVRHSSVHACAVGIVNSEINDYMGMTIGGAGERVIQVDKRILEKIGIVKMDLLGVVTLTVVQDCLKLIGKDSDLINPNRNEFLNDKKTFELLQRADTVGVFQVESYGMQDLLRRLVPSNIGDISAVLALYRPDTMDMIGDYIERKHGRKDIKYIHHDMKPILMETQGKMIYQEELLEIVRTFGGRSYGAADLFRKGVGSKDKKLVQEEANKLYQEIIDNGYPEPIARTISDDLAELGGYSFNKSHSLGYSVLTMQTAYLKANYPKEFMTALLNSCLSMKDNKYKIKYKKLTKYILDANKRDITVLPPKMNLARENFTINGDDIVFGLMLVKGIGQALVPGIVKERDDNGEYKSFGDFSKRIHMSKKEAVSLIKAGAFCNEDKKMSLMKHYAKSIFEPNVFKPVTTAPSPAKLLEDLGVEISSKEENYKQKRIDAYNEYKLKKHNQWQKEKHTTHITEFREKYVVDRDFWEYSVLSMFVTHNPLSEIEKNVKKLSDVKVGDKCTCIGVISSIDKKTNKNKAQYAFIDFYTNGEMVELISWHDSYKNYTDLIVKDSVVVILGKKTEADKITLEKMKPLEEWKKQKGIK